MSPGAELAAPQLEWDADAYQRASVLAGVPALLAEFGVPAERALDGLPLDPSVFAEPDRYLPFAWVTRILGNCAEASRRPHFGLLLGARASALNLGAPGRWLADAPDLLTAITGFQSLQPTNSRGAAVYLRRAGEDYILGYGVYDRTAAAVEQAYAYTLALAFNIVRELTGEAARPSEVMFSFRRPADASHYAALFGAPVRFDQFESGLVLPAAALKAPIPGSKVANFDFWRAKALEIAPRSGTPWTAEVRHALRPLLLGGAISAPAAAALLSIDARTLSRRLAAEGTSFRRTLDDVRHAFARELLAITDLEIADIALALAYATHGAFDVAFRRWSGVSPSAWRGANRAGAATARQSSRAGP